MEQVTREAPAYIVLKVGGLQVTEIMHARHAQEEDGCRIKMFALKTTIAKDAARQEHTPVKLDSRQPTSAHLYALLENIQMQWD